MMFIGALLSLNLTVQAGSEIRSSLFKKPEVLVPSTDQSKSKATGVSKRSDEPRGNLPKEYNSHSGAHPIDGGVVILPATKVLRTLSALPTGRVVQAIILESVIAFGDSKAPVRAVISTGQLKGSVLLGEATLERNSKRILVTFKTVRKSHTQETYMVSASALDSNGIVGLEGELVSGETAFFLAELLSAGAAGFADASVNRSQNMAGNYVDEPSTDTYGKKAAAGALSKTADRFGEKLKSVPEYSVLRGPVPIKILITDEPKL